jgi:acyl-CoA-binding protein
MYSLFKQIEEGDADALDEDGIIDETQNEKKSVWL